MHCAIVRFHNSIARSGRFSRFDDVRRQVTLCIQKILLEDFLPRLTPKGLVKDILSGNRFTDSRKVVNCPAESVLAALRFGHSMVRREYSNWNQFRSSAASVTNLLRYTGSGGGLENGVLPSDWTIDWRSMFDFGEESVGRLTYAKSIDTIIDERLASLPDRLFEIRKDVVSLAYRTLWFGGAAQIMDGWTVQQKLSDKVGQSEFYMSGDCLTANRPDLQSLFESESCLRDRPPLWWFILREAELFGVDGGLAGVGARIVAETVIAAIEVSVPSVLNGDTICDQLPGGASQAATMTNMLRWGGQPLDWYRAAHSIAN